ncbi:Hypp7340 [Branchiostoma lanceolatum]|nr:Hypp7340 [Branchiostoma lanceolatum]
MNVRTIKEAQRREELSTNMALCDIDVLGIQEHRIVHEDDVRYESIHGNMLITTSANRNLAGAAVGGVGMLLSPKAYNSLAKVTPFNDRILIVNFQGNPATTIMVTYCPTNVADENIINEHYDNLRSAIRSIPAHNLLMIVGDFNARIGSEEARYTFHSETNRNGKMLLELSSEQDFIISSTRFQKKAGKLWTYMSPGGNKYQLDYILIRRKWQNSMLNVEAYNTFASVGSDHRIVSARVRLSLRKKKNEPRKKQYDWGALRRSKDLQDQFAIEVRNKFQPLQEETETATERYGRFITANEEAAEKTIPIKKREKRVRYSSDPRVTQARDEVNRSNEVFLQNTQEENRQKLKRARKALEETYTKVEEEDLLQKIKEVEKAHENCKHGQSWKLINEITNRRETKKSQLEGNSQKERVTNWYNHFKNLLGNPPDITCEDEDIPAVLENLDIKIGPFDREEYEKAKKSLVEGKSCGEDGIPPEVLKRCQDLDEVILDFCNKALLEGEKPAQWSTLNIVPIPKSGNLRLAGNYRGISLSSIVAKTFNRLILNRIRPALDMHLRRNQNGFRVGRSTVGHILALRRLIEGIKTYNLTAIITFIDFKKAFDTVHRGKMLKILKAYGIPDQLVEAIASMYQDTKAKVISPDGETELFDLYAGVLQGDTLAPYLFVIVVDYALRMAIDGREEELGLQIERRRSRRVGPKTVTDFDFADDIALISEAITQAQELLGCVESSVGKVGLCMNAGKTKFMAFNIPTPYCLKTSDGTALEEVKDFKYLGSRMESTEKDITARKAAAWQACNKLKKVWRSNLSRKLKVRLFLSTVEAVLLYGCEAWTITSKLEKQLDGCYTRLLRSALNIHWSQHITNKDLYAGLPKLSDKIRTRRLKFAGHCLRSKEEVADLVLWTPRHGKRRPGRPAATYIDTLKKDTGLEVDSLLQAMRDRATWTAITTRDRPVST